jgi:RNA polymerase sigma factor (sigma-70 family)
MDKVLSHEEKCKLIPEMYEWLIGVVINIGLGFQDAADIVQEGCCRFLQYPVRRAAWLTRTVINLAFEFLKENRKKSRIPLDVCLDIKANCLEPWEIVHRKNTLKAVYRTILLMENKYREVLILRYFIGLSVKKISERIGVPERTVLTRLYRARRILINFLT